MIAEIFDITRRFDWLPDGWPALGLIFFWFYWGNHLERDRKRVREEEVRKGGNGET